MPGFIRRIIMAALVDFTTDDALTLFADVAPGWDKVRVDFSKTNLTDGDWAKIMTIPAHTYVFDTMTYIVKIQATGTTIYLGDANADHELAWNTNITAAVADVVAPTLVADTNGATRGKFYHTAGGIYMSSTVTLTTVVIDVYVQHMHMSGA
jgi:hypothetical protein